MPNKKPALVLSYENKIWVATLIRRLQELPDGYCVALSGSLMGDAELNVFKPGNNPQHQTIAYDF